MDDVLLETKALQVGYVDKGQPRNSLHSDININLSKGEFVCLLGPNGAGKSTLIKTLSGFIPPLSGEVFVNNKPLSKLKLHDIAKTTSVVLTEQVAPSNMTVFDLVALGRVPYTGFFGRLSSKDVGVVNQAIHDVGLDGFAERMVSLLSDGERQKAVIAKALVQDTPLIILDEPTAFLDLPSRIEIMYLLKIMAKQRHKAILLSTHDLDLALQMADKIWLLAAGRDIEVGTPEDLVLDNGFSRFFNKEGLLFDNDSGSFKVVVEDTKPICLNGRGTEYQWVSRALKRVGYKTTTSIGNYPQVEITSNGHREYTLQMPNGKTQKALSIHELLGLIQVSGN